MFFLLKLAYPHVFDYAEVEFSSLTLRCFESGKIDLSGLVNCPLSGADWCLLFLTY